jgi:Ribonuclease G/E
MDDESWGTPDEDMSSETGSSTAHTDEEDRDVLMSDPEDDEDDDSMECDVDVNTKGMTKVEEAEDAEEEKEQEEGGEEESTTKARAPRHMTQDAAETASPVRKVCLPIFAIMSSN